MSPPCGSTSGSASTAMRSTAPTTAINQWLRHYQKQCRAPVKSNPTGSGSGVKNFNPGQVDCAGSDSALDPTKGEVAAAQKRCGSAPLDLPMVVGPIAVA